MKKLFRCSHCDKENKDRNCFIFYSKTGRSKYYYCKKCHNERMRAYTATKAGKLAHRKALKVQYFKNHRKVLARATLNRALRKSEVKKPKNCLKCKKRKPLDGHHDNYKKPLKVKWMCRQCHVEYHKKR